MAIGRYLAKYNHEQFDGSLGTAWTFFHYAGINVAIRPIAVLC